MVFPYLSGAFPQLCRGGFHIRPHGTFRPTTSEFGVAPSFLVGRGLAPAGEDPDKNLSCVKGVSSAKRDGGIVFSAGASPHPTTDLFALS